MSEVRASDEDRERFAAELREHFTAGRLTQDELDERVQAAYGARTAAQLDALRRDLPRLPATPAQQKAEIAARRAQLQRRLLQQSGGALVPFTICTVIWLASGARGGFWPVWILLVALIPMVRGGWQLYGPAPEIDRVERELDRREARDHRRHARRHERRNRV